VAQVPLAGEGLHAEQPLDVAQVPPAGEGLHAEQPLDVAQVPPAAQVRDVPRAAHPAASLPLKLSPGPQRG
jgi:hypothetical protein